MIRSSLPRSSRALPLLGLAALSLVSPQITAQRNYDRLWKDVAAHAAQDRPRNALEGVALVRREALREGNEGQLLRAMLTERVFLGELSPDSVRVATNRMEAMLQADTPQRRPLDAPTRALWHIALGRLYALCPYSMDDATLDEDSIRTRALRHIEASLADPTALATTTTKRYAALFDKAETGKGSVSDSRTIYGDDLLHLIYRTAEASLRRLDAGRIGSLRNRLISVYDSLDRTDAALTLRLEAINSSADEALPTAVSRQGDNSPLRNGGGIETTPRYRALTALAAQYADRPAVVRVWEAVTDLRNSYDDDSPLAAHNDSVLLKDARTALSRLRRKIGKAETAQLQRFIADHEAPLARLEGLPTLMRPGAKIKVKIRTRHVGKVALRLTPLAWSRAAYDLALARDGNIVPKGLGASRLDGPRTETFNFSPAQPWVQQVGTIAFAAPGQPGVYGVQLVIDGKVTSEQAVVSVSALQSLTLSLNGGSRVVAVDAATGTPVTGATLTAYGADSENNARSGEDTPRQWRTWPMGADATVNLPSKGLRRDLSFYIHTATDAAAPSFSLRGYGYYAPTTAGLTVTTGGGEDTTAAPGAIVVPTESPAQDRSTTVDLFTDRAIYRPGQQVEFAAIAYVRDTARYAVIPNMEAAVKLFSANGRAVDSLTVRTDDYGTLSGTLRLPAVTLPGTFRLELSRGGVSASRWIRVEEYVRPTFTVETEALKAAYALGDTVSVKGSAKTYAGVPIEGAKVRYRVRTATWWLGGGGSEQSSPVEGETITDSTGAFHIPVALTRPVGDDNQHIWRPTPYNRYSFVVTADVTADNGETRSASTTLHAADWRSRLEMEWGEHICRERPAKLKIRRVNAADNDLKGTGPWRIETEPEGKTLAKGTYETGKAFVPDGLQTLPSGNYRLIVSQADRDSVAGSGASCEAISSDTLRFVLFSDNDTRPADRLNPFFAESHTDEQGAAVTALIGTKAPHAVLYYDLVSAAGHLVDSRRLTLSDSLARFDLRYAPAYGDGATAFFALVNEGKLFTYTCEVQRPTADRRLLMRWETFRSLLTPGREETWRLRVTRPDGRPAGSQVMATLYDASLDAFRRHDWRLSALYDPRILPYGSWRLPAYTWQTDLTAQLDPQPTSSLLHTYTDWRSDLFDCYGADRFYDAYPLITLAGRSNGLEAMADAAVPTPRLMRKNALAAPVAKSEEVRVQGSGSRVTRPATDNVRKNFNETAYFRPALRTDSLGRVSLTFTLPEATTQWRLLALAHDRTMNNGRLDTLVTARKELMVSPTLPQYVRRGDCLTIPVKVTNLNPETVKARLTLTLDNALSQPRTGTATLTTLLRASRDVTLAPGKSLVAYSPYTVTTEAAVMRCTAQAASNRYADGEEHLVTVIDDREVVTRTLPFTLDGRGSQTLRIDTLFAGDDRAGHGTKAPKQRRSLEVEITSHPLWMVVGALPVLAREGTGQSALDQATRFYALALSQGLTQHVPALRHFADSLTARLQRGGKEAGEATKEAALLSQIHDEAAYDQTPWLGAADRERQRNRALATLLDEDMAAASRHSALDKLAALQRPDGAWSWYPGMGPSTSVTLRIALLLTRAQKLGNAEGADKPLLKAYDYLKAEMARQQAEADKQPTTAAVTGDQLDYLYLRALLGERPDADARRLMDRAIAQPRALSHHDKAVLATALAEGGREREARDLLESLLQHTVATPMMGRYFDAPRDFSQDGAERLTTQCLTIEALDHFGRKAEADAMRRYLLQTKRTEGWETSAATASAVYALLSAPDSEGTLGSLTDDEPVVYTLKRGTDIVGLNSRTLTQGLTTVGYSSLTYDSPAALAADRLTVRKVTDGPAWGHVTATSVASASEIKASAQGLGLTRTLDVWRGGKWTALSADGATPLRVGDRMRLTFTLTADRDYDYVSLTSARPACLAERQPLSGYCGADGLACYRATGVAETTYYIERVEKGTHRLTEELVVNRTGSYASGTARLTSVFAPAFRAQTAGYRLEVK